MASHWLYCCRVGTQDPRGRVAATRVLGDKRCHGTNKFKKARQWHTGWPGQSNLWLHKTQKSLLAMLSRQIPNC